MPYQSDFFMAQNTITTKGVLIINGKQVENTFKDLQATTRKLASMPQHQRFYFKIFQPDT